MDCDDVDGQGMVQLDLFGDFTQQELFEQKFLKDLIKDENFPVEPNSSDANDKPNSLMGYARGLKRAIHHLGEGNSSLEKRLSVLKRNQDEEIIARMKKKLLPFLNILDGYEVVLGASKEFRENGNHNEGVGWVEAL